MTSDTDFFHEVLRQTGIEDGSERVPEAVISAALANDYALGGVLTRIETEKDDTFRLDASGRRFLVKAAPSAEDPEIVDLQTTVMTHLEEHAPDLPTQRIVRGIHQQTETTVLDRTGRQRTVRVLTFVEGQLLHHVAATSEQLRAVGSVLAHLDNALVGFRHARDGRLLLWDLKLFTTMRHLASYLDDAGDRRLAYRVFDRFDEHVTGLLTSLEAQMIHGDFSPHNVVVNPSTPEFIAGVIDFGDAMRSPLLFELSVPAANLLGADPSDPWAGAVDVVRGYSQVRNLEPEVAELLAYTAPARLLLRALIYQWRSRRDARSRHYAMVHSAQDWERLRLALAVDEDSLRARLARATTPSQGRTKGMP